MCYCNPSIRTPYCNSPICQDRIKQIWSMPMNKEIKQAKIDMMNMFIQELETQLMVRTSWGRNDLKEAIKDIKMELLEKIAME